MRFFVRLVSTAVCAFFFLSPVADAATDREVVLRYDAARKRFTCLWPGQPPAANPASQRPTPPDALPRATCPDGWAEYYPGYVLKRGDVVYLQVVNTHYDLYLQVTAAGQALTPPPLVPVAGESLKAISALLPDSLKVGGAKQAGLSDNAFFQAVAEPDAPKAEAAWKAFLQPILETLATIQAEPLVDRIKNHSAQVLTFRQESESLSPGSSDLITEYLGLRLRFDGILNEQADLANRARAFAKALPDVLVDHPERLTLLDEQAGKLADEIRKALDSPSAPAVLTHMEDRIRSAGLSVPSKSIIERNLKAFATNGCDKVQEWWEVTFRNPIRIREINLTIPQIAFRMNALPAHLPQEVTEYRLGQWYDNQTVTVTVAAGPRFAPYTAGVELKTLGVAPSETKPIAPPVIVGPVAPIGAPPPPELLKEQPKGKKKDAEKNSGNGQHQPADPAAEGSGGKDDKDSFVVESQTTPATAIETKTVATAVLEVHQLYRFRIAPGFVRSTLHDVKYEEAAREVPDGVDKDGQPKTREERYLLQTRDREYQIFPTLSLVYYPHARDLFPKQWKPAFGVLAGLSLVDPRRDFVLGGTIEFTPAVAIYAGWHFGYQPEPGPGLKAGNAVPVNEVAFVENKLKRGTFVGLTFDFTLFKQLFGALGF